MSARDVPFLEQVKLFSETMNERFIEADVGKSLVVFAIDVNKEGQTIELVHPLFGDDFDLAYCIALARREPRIERIISASTQIMKHGFDRHYK